AEGGNGIAKSLLMKSCETPGVGQMTSRKDVSDAQRVDSRRGDSTAEQPRTAIVNEESGVEEPATPALTINQTVVLTASACLAIVAALTAIVVFRFTPARAAANSETIQKTSAGVISPGDGVPTFKVEVLETAGGRFFLDFSNDASTKATAPTPNAR